MTESEMRFIKMNNQIREVTPIVKALATQITSTNQNNELNTPPNKEENAQDVVNRDTLCYSDTLSALNEGAKRSGATCLRAMPHRCYLANSAKRPSHSTNMISIFFGFVQPKFIFGLVQPNFIFELVPPKFIFGLVNSRC